MYNNISLLHVYGIAYSDIPLVSVLMEVKVKRKCKQADAGIDIDRYCIVWFAVSRIC